MASLFGRKIKWHKDDGRAQTMVRSGGEGSAGVNQTEGRNAKALKEYWLYYKGEGTVFASINMTSWNTIMTGYTLESADEEALTLVQDLCDNINLEEALLDATLSTLIFGDAFIEKRRLRNGEVSQLFVVDSRTMVIDFDQYGKIKSYHQELEGKKGKPIKPEDIIHIRFFPMPDSPYGVSIISPSKDTIDRKIDTDNSLYQAIKRHGTRKVIAYVGTESDGQIPPDDVMDEIAEKLEDLNSKHAFVVPWMIKFDTMDEGGIQGVEEYFNYFQTLLTVGLLCPEEALGLGRGSTEATARQKAILYERMIKAFQRRIAKTVKKDLFDEHLIRNKFYDKINGKEIPTRVTLKFNEVTEEDVALKAKWFGNMLRGFPDGSIPFTGNEIRGIFGYTAREGLDELLYHPEATEGEEPKKKPKEKEEEMEPDVEEEEGEEQSDETTT